MVTLRFEKCMSKLDPSLILQERFEFQTRARVTITCVDSSDNNSKSVANHTNKKRDCVSVNKISLSLFILATADSLDFSLQRSSK